MLQSMICHFAKSDYLLTIGVLRVTWKRMKNKSDTETIRIRRHTKLALCRAAYNPPFQCASLAEFIALIERGDESATKAFREASIQMYREKNEN